MSAAFFYLEIHLWTIKKTALVAPVLPLLPT